MQQPTQQNNKKKRSPGQEGINVGTRRYKSPSPFDIYRPQQLEELDTKTKQRQSTSKKQSQKSMHSIVSFQHDQRNTSAGGSAKGQKLMDMHLRSASELVPGVNQDCHTSENCIWKKRYMELVRENERNKQSQKNNLTKNDYTISNLKKQNIELAAEKSELEDRVRHYEKALQNKVTDLQGRSTQAGSRYIGAVSATSSPAGAGIFNTAAGLQMLSRQSEVVNTKNKPLSSEIGWPAGRKPEKSNFSNAFISNASTYQLQVPSEDTTSVRIPILFSHEKSRENDNYSPLTQQQPGSNIMRGTPHVIILEEKFDADDDLSDSSEKFVPRVGSDFSLSNQAGVRIQQEDANLSNDDIVVDDGKSTEGLGERNNPFAMHQFTHRVDNEETPSQPNNVRPLSSSRDGPIQAVNAISSQLSQTVQNPIDESFFTDDLLKETPSFVDAHSDRDDTIIELNRMHNSDDAPLSLQPIRQNSASFNSDLNAKVTQQKTSQEKKFMSNANSVSSPLPPLVSSASKKASLKGNAWEKAQALGQAPLPPHTQQQKQQQLANERNFINVSQSGQFAPQKSFGTLKQPSETSVSQIRSINLVQSQTTELNQPHERVDSDEIELQDSEEDGCDETENIDFGSIEAKANVLLPTENRLPKTQTMFNNVDQMSRLNHQNLTIIQQMQSKLALQKITEEPLQTTSEFSTTYDKETNRLSSRQTSALQRQLTSESYTEPQETNANHLRSNTTRQQQPLGRASSAVVIDDDEEGEDSDFERDEDEEDICLDHMTFVPRQQPSIIVMSEGRPSDLFEENKILLNMNNGEGFEPLEAINDTTDSLFEPARQQESGAHYNVQPRFSTLMSERDSAAFLGRSTTGSERQQAFFLPQSFSHIAPPGQNLELSELEGPPVREVRPSTNLVVNQRHNQHQLPAMNMSMSIPYGCELNITDDAFIAIEENVGEESKETTIRKADRVHGPSFVRRGQSRGSSMVLDLDATEITRGPVIFDSRKRIIADTSGMPLNVLARSAGNEQLKKPTPQDSQGLSILEDDSNNTPAAMKTSINDEFISPEPKSTAVNASNFFHQVNASQKSNQDRYTDLSQEPEFFNDLVIQAQHSKNKKPPRMKKDDAMTLEDLGSSEIGSGKATVPTINGTAEPKKSNKPLQDVSLQLNRSMNNNKMTSSIMFDNKRGTSDVLLMPRSSFLRGKQSMAMHASIVNSNKATNINLLANGGMGPFDKSGRLSRGILNDGTLKLRSIVGIRNNSIAGKSQNPSLSNVPIIADDDDKLIEYDEQGATRSLEETEKIRQKTLNTRQKHMQNKQQHQKDHLLHPQLHQQMFTESANQAQAQHLHMTTESAELKSCLAEEHKKTIKKQHMDLRIPLKESLFSPPTLNSSIVSVTSPVAEEESDVSFDHRARNFQQSPKPFHGKMDFYSGRMKDPNVGKSGPSFSLKDTTMAKIDNVGRKAMQTVRQFAQRLTGATPPAENLLWFAHLLELRTIHSKYFFEKYMVVGLADEQLAEHLNSKGDFEQRALKPKVLFSTPCMTRSSSNFNEEQYLIDDETVEIIADFCFPNGVQILRMSDFQPGVSYEKQSQVMRGYIDAVVHEQTNVRGDMFCFTLDASDAIEVKEGGEIYGDCHLIALVHTFMDFKEYDGRLYLVKNALCIVTTSPSYFGLLSELLDQNMIMIRHQRQNLIAQPELLSGSAEYPPEIQACLQTRFEQPLDDFVNLLEGVRSYKQDYLDKAIDSEGQLFEEVKVPIGSSGFTFEYHFPSGSKQAIAQGALRLTMKDMQLDLINHHWHMSIFFSLFGPDTFYKVLTAVMLERSIVFVHREAMVVSNVIFALKTLLRPFMWCSSLIPVLPRPLFDYLLQPLPVLVGISQSDYDKALKTTTEQERREKTWIFLDAEMANLLGDYPEFLPFESYTNDIDSRSGIRIVWGTMDNDFSEEWRTEMLLAWLDEMKVSAKHFFDMFEKGARSEEQGTEALPTVLSSFDQHFKYATGAEDDDGDPNIDSRPSLGEMIKSSNRKKTSQSQEFNLTPIKLCVRKLDTDEDQVNQRDSNLSGQGRAFNIGAAFDDLIVTDDGITKRQEEDIIIEQTDNTDADDDDYEHIQTEFMPIVIIPSERLRHAIEQICLQLARTYREKILSKVPDLCQLCGIEEAEQVFDSEKLASQIGELVPPDQQKGRMFLEQFAYTQMFSFLLENYIAARNMKQLESEISDAGGVPSRQSDYMLNKFTNYADRESAVELSWSRHTMSSQLDTLQSAQINSYQTEQQVSRKNSKHNFASTSQSSLKDILEQRPASRANSRTARGEN